MQKQGLSCSSPRIHAECGPAIPQKDAIWRLVAVRLSRSPVMPVTAEIGMRALNRALAKFHECAMFKQTNRKF